MSVAQKREEIYILALFIEVNMWGMMPNLDKMFVSVSIICIKEYLFHLFFSCCCKTAANTTINTALFCVSVGLQYYYLSRLFLE